MEFKLEVGNCVIGFKIGAKVDPWKNDCLLVG